MSNYSWPHGLWPARALQVDSLPAEPPGKPKNTGEGSLSLLQRIFPTQESNQALLNCKWIVYHLSHQGSPRILECVAYPFSRGSSWPRHWTWVSHITDRFFTIWAIYTDAIHRSLHGVISFWRESMRITFKYLLSGSFLKFSFGNSHLEIWKKSIFI